MRISVCFQGSFAPQKPFEDMLLRSFQPPPLVFHICCGHSLCTIVKESINLLAGSEGLAEGCHSFGYVVMAASGPFEADREHEHQAPDVNVKIYQVSGFVKWFDVGRGYGFIIPDNGMPDVLLHLSCLKRDGFDAPLEGTRIFCEAVEGQKG